MLNFLNNNVIINSSTVDMNNNGINGNITVNKMIIQIYKLALICYHQASDHQL